jgi:hypothetical protein
VQSTDPVGCGLGGNGCVGPPHRHACSERGTHGSQVYTLYPAGTRVCPQGGDKDGEPAVTKNLYVVRIDLQKPN